ncbi:MAG: hypothetical protein B6242_15015 [Anaerolineaceae bacterium 4572_78]|nr:MAG: hypothetical protein B6242_15015 [Anaerolineaceae bacterium 4572_78]
MKRFVYQQLLPITILACLSVPVQAATTVNINNIVGMMDIEEIIDPSSSSADTCDEKNLTTLRFALNDKVIEEDLMLTPFLFELGDIFSIKLVEDLRVCSRQHRVDLWIGIKLPDGGEIFMIETDEFPYTGFTSEPQPFTTDLESSNHSISLLSNFEVRKGFSGNYDFYAAYTEADTKIGSLLFTLRSNRPSVKLVLGR